MKKFLMSLILVILLSGLFGCTATNGVGLIGGILSGGSAITAKGTEEDPLSSGSGSSIDVDVVDPLSTEGVTGTSLGNGVTTGTGGDDPTSSEYSPLTAGMPPTIAKEEDSDDGCDSTTVGDVTTVMLDLDSSEGGTMMGAPTAASRFSSRILESFSTEIYRRTGSRAVTRDFDQVRSFGSVTQREDYYAGNAYQCRYDEETGLHHWESTDMDDYEVVVEYYNAETKLVEDMVLGVDREDGYFIIDALTLNESYGKFFFIGLKEKDADQVIKDSVTLMKIDDVIVRSVREIKIKPSIDSHEMAPRIIDSAPILR